MSNFGAVISRLWRRTEPLPGGASPDLSLILIRGRTRNRQVPLECAYIGNNAKTLAHWKQLIFSSIDDQTAEKVRLDRPRRLFGSAFPDCSLLIVESDVPAAGCFSRERQFAVPFFVNMSIDLTRFDEGLNYKQKKSYSNSRRLISKYQLEFDWSSSADDLRDFYDNLYRPFIQRRHDEQALVLAYSDVFTDRFPQRLMRIKRAGRVIAGGVINFRDSQPTLAFFGTRDGEYDIVRQGALGALYYFAVMQMREEGYGRLLIGGTPPVLTHGLTRHKLQRLAVIDRESPYRPANMVSCLLLRDSAGLRDLLGASPFVFVDGSGGLAGTVWAYPGKYGSREEFEYEVNLSFRCGLNECRVFEFERNALPGDWLTGLRSGGRIGRQSAGQYCMFPGSWRFFRGR